MTKFDFMGLMPILVIDVSILVVMMSIALKRTHIPTAVLTVVGILVALLAIPCADGVAPRLVTSLLVVDQFALFFMTLILLASLAVTLLSTGYFAHRKGFPEEYYLMLLLATSGAMLLVASVHLISIFISLELMTISLYVMVGYVRVEKRALEAGLKYLVLASVSSTFLIFGMGLLYAETGTMELARLAEILKGAESVSLYIWGGLGLILVAIGFKMALVPFHMWTADVYEGAPAPVTAYVATVSKGAVVGIALRLYLLAGPLPESVLTTLAWIAILSMFAGNLLALLQDNIKRMLAYSSIAHLGYLLIAFLSGGSYASEAVAYYLIAYMVTSLATFGVISVLSSRSQIEVEWLKQLRGLYWTHPGIAGVLTAGLLSLAGIPLTAGFIGKFYLVSAAVQADSWWLLTSLIINSGIGLCYYLRIVAAMYDSRIEEKQPVPVVTYALAGGVALALVTIVVIWLGVYPGTLIDLIRGNLGRLI